MELIPTDPREAFSTVQLFEAQLVSSQIGKSMPHLNIPDVFEFPDNDTEKGNFSFVAFCAVAAIVIGAFMILVAAHEDVVASPPQVATVL